MGRAILLIDMPLLIWAATYTVLYWRLRRRVRAIDDPVLCLPRKERREHARELLRREGAEYIQSQIERQTGYIEKEK